MDSDATDQDASSRPGVVIVTGGAGGGIGQAISHAVAQSGDLVVIADRDLPAAEHLAQQLRTTGVLAVGRYLDVADETSVGEFFADVPTELGPLRGLVHSAGVGLIRRLADVSTAEWDRVHGVDLRGAFLCARAAIPLLIENGGGTIVNIGSVQALGPHVGYSTYAAAKAGLIGLTRGIAADHGRDGIRCSIIHPGFVDSPQNRQLLAGWGDPETWIQHYINTRQMTPRPITGAEIGAAAVFLLSDAARSITAAEITVDGGSSRMAFDNTDPHEPGDHS
ncbi:SDR family NAD(P)-dependent oxidoreductase [Microbacterium sp. P5_E9]